MKTGGTVRHSLVMNHLDARFSAVCMMVLFFVIFFAAASFHRAEAEVCSRVSIEIPQELTLERIAFDAKMVITNNVPDKDLTNIRVDVTIQDADGNVKNDIFFMRVSSMTGIASVDGSGIVRAATTAEIHWLIIPSPGAGGSDPRGTPYWVGATLTYVVDGNQEVVTVNPDRITVRPEAQLILDYFSPYEVIGDNPFTPQVEPPVPFPLAVRVVNAGYGPARNLKIDSGQPKIVANAQGLLVDFRLLGTSVNDSAVSNTLTVDFGTLGSKEIATAYWEMISTLSGRFVEFDVTFSHASELGGELTSLIKETNAYYLTHRVKVNIPGRDHLLDFLADTDNDPDRMPDTIFESEIPGGSGDPADSRSPVTAVGVVHSPVNPTPQSPSVELQLQTGDSGWIYARLPDPSRGMLRLLDVVRADGVHLDPHNFWVSEGLDENHRTVYTLHILDYRAGASVTGTYSLVYEQPSADLVPPSTNLIFSGPVQDGDPVFITPETRIIYTATDNDGGSGVDAMFRKIVGVDADFVPAYPMFITEPGDVELEYYSVDGAGNEEPVKTAYLHVDNAAPSIDAFIAVPSTFTPHAPTGVAADRTTGFIVKASDARTDLQAEIEVAAGETFDSSNVVRTLTASLLSAVETSIPWDGRDDNGQLVPTGTYTARLRVTDGLEGGTMSHSSYASVQVVVDEWFRGEPLDPNLSGEQKYPDISGTRVVWQDNRNGNWDIYTKVIGGTVSQQITSDMADQIRPAADGDIIVWQDNRNGNWDIYGYDLSAGREFVVCDDPGNQERPVISGYWIAWQDDRDGNLDIFAYNMNTQAQVRITGHERDQMHPSLSGGVLVWEDYRHGLGELYRYDLASGVETRITYSSTSNETLPVVSGGTLVWTDQRNNQRDIYFSDPSNRDVRVTYGTGDHSQADIMSGVIVYTDYEAGYGDPNLAFYDIASGLGDRLTADPARQEEPALGTGAVAWQDDRDGVYQIYWAPFQVEALPVSVEIRPGFNLIAVGRRLASQYGKASDLISSGPAGIGIERVIAYNSLNGVMLDSARLDEIVLQEGMGIGLYASGGGTLDTADAGEEAVYTLYPGVNYIGLLSVPNGYSAYNLLQSIGFDNVQSVRKFNSITGLWETASVRAAGTAREAVGKNFVINPGDGLIITMHHRVDGWKP